MAAFPSQEHRPLKKMRLGSVGPDVYLQDKKQKEDELNQLSVKHGFSNVPVTKDEHGSAKDQGLNASKIAAAFNAVLDKKHDLNTFQDQNRKKLVINTKDNFWAAGIPCKLSPEAWIKDLAGTKPLSVLAKKVPIFNKKEEIFQKLVDENVPLMRAAWFIKMTNAYYTALSEEKKTKKRQTSDPFLEWTQALTRFLYEQLQKIIEHYKGSGAQVGFLTAGPASVIDVDAATRQWNYGVLLVQHMYDEGLIDRHEFLSWLIELLEKVRVADDTVLKLILGQALRYTSEFVQSQLLSRRLAYFCCKKLSQICTDSSSSLSSPTCQSAAAAASSASNDANSSTSPSATAAVATAASNAALPVNAATSVFTELCNCPQHRSLILGLSAIIQAIVISCPSALVWHNLGDGKSTSPLNGSPLDLLPCSPSNMPMPAGSDNHRIRLQLRAAEEQIILRSRAVEMQWSSDKCQQSVKGQVINHVLNCLEIIDKQNFEKVETNNSLDVLHHKLFGSCQSNKDGAEHTAVVDEAVINLLLEWAVSTKRTGEHRAIVVAKLLEKYQMDLTSDSVDGEAADDHESMVSDAASSGIPMFQNQLMQFLDTKAPVLEENPTVDNRQAFANLISLFTELIRHEVFSHDVYVCTLISRGDLLSSNSWNSYMQVNSVNPDHSELSSVKSEGIKQEVTQVHSTDFVLS